MNPLDRIHPLDQWTRNIDRALGILFLKDPVRSSLGVVLGGAMFSLCSLFEPALQAVALANFATMPWWTWIVPGIAVMHIPAIMQLLRKPSARSCTIDMLFDLIARGDFSAAERRQLYRRLIERFVELAAADQLRNSADSSKALRC